MRASRRLGILLATVVQLCCATTPPPSPASTTSTLPWHDTELTVTSTTCGAAVAEALPLTVSCPSRHFPPWQKGTLPAAGGTLATSWAPSWRSCLARRHPELSSCSVDVEHNGPVGPSLWMTPAGTRHVHARQARALVQANADAAASALDAALPWVQRCFAEHGDVDDDRWRARANVQLDVEGMVVRRIVWRTDVSTAAFRRCVDNGVLAMRLPMAVTSSATWTWMFILSSDPANTAQESATTVLSTLTSHQGALDRCLGATDGRRTVQLLKALDRIIDVRVLRGRQVLHQPSMCLRDALAQPPPTTKEVVTRARATVVVVDGSVRVEALKTTPSRLRADIQREIKLHGVDIDRCTQWMPAGETKVVTRFSIDSDGIPQKVNIQHPLTSETAAKCIAASVRRMRFGRAKVRGHVHVTYPFVFNLRASP